MLVLKFSGRHNKCIFRTLEGLVNKGVKVDLGIPQGLWDKPSAEITQLKTQCESLLEDFEEDIEDWYFNKQVKYYSILSN